jgi:hypothetical protein
MRSVERRLQNVEAAIPPAEKPRFKVRNFDDFKKWCETAQDMEIDLDDAPEAFLRELHDFLTAEKARLLEEGAHEEL